MERDVSVYGLLAESGRERPLADHLEPWLDLLDPADTDGDPVEAVNRLDEVGDGTASNVRGSIGEDVLLPEFQRTKYDLRLEGTDGVATYDPDSRTLSKGCLPEEDIPFEMDSERTGFDGLAVDEDGNLVIVESKINSNNDRMVASDLGDTDNGVQLSEDWLDQKVTEWADDPTPEQRRFLETLDDEGYISLDEMDGEIIGAEIERNNVKTELAGYQDAPVSEDVASGTLRKSGTTTPTVDRVEVLKITDVFPAPYYTTAKSSPSTPMTMDEDSVRRFVTDQQASLREGTESDDLSDVIGHSRLAATRVGLGLLYLGELAEAQEWFGAVSEKWKVYFEYYREKHLDPSDPPRIGKLKWNGLLKMLQTALLSGATERIEASASFALEEATNPELKDLRGAEGTPRVSAIAALASVVLGRDPVEHLDRLASRLEHTDREHDHTYYPIVTQLIEGMQTDNVDAVADAIDDLEPYHEEFRRGTGVAQETEEAVNLDACAYLVLARREGLDVRVESEYVPDGIYDERYYPVGEWRR